VRNDIEETNIKIVELRIKLYADGLLVDEIVDATLWACIHRFILDSRVKSAS
jgi:hypothetical protein